MGRKIEIELPDPEPPAIPDLSVDPAVADIRERLARLETRTEGLDSAAAAEGLRLAGEAHQLASGAAQQVQDLALKVEKSVPPETPVVSVTPPEPVPAPPPDPDPQLPASQEHHPWWHPSRWV